MTWTTGNEAVATVADGVVTAVGAGSTVITATCGSVKAECTVTVTASPLTVSVGGKTSPFPALAARMDGSTVPCCLRQ